MSQIEVSKKHSLGKAGARKTAEKIAESLSKEYNAKCKWSGDDLTFSSTGVKGKLHVSDEDVQISVDLGLVLRPLKGKIESSIVSQLDDILDDDSSVA
jgi:putative polyhydroxyalkanoate system protein